MKKSHLFFIIAFFLVILIPSVGMLFYKTDGNTENRYILPFSEVTGINSLSTYIYDNHAFRYEMTDMYFNFSLRYLHESPIPGRAVLGKDGWAFLGDNHEDIYSTSLGIMPIEKEKVDSVCFTISQIKRFCDSLDIKFYFVIAPNKATIYPEYLPMKPNRLKHPKDYVSEQLAQKYNLNAIDLTNCLLAKKDSVILYMKTDTHWNNYGALLGTKAVMDVVAQDLPVRRVNESDFLITTNLQFDNKTDLAQSLRIGAQETIFTLMPRAEKGVSQITETHVSDIIITTENPLGRTYASGIIFKDSFFPYMQQPFANSIHKGTYIASRTYFDEKPILEAIARGQKPDFVLFEIVERNLLIIEYHR